MSAKWIRITPGAYVREADGYRVDIVRNDNILGKYKWEWISLRKSSDGIWDKIHEGTSESLRSAKSASAYWIRLFHNKQS